MNPKLLKQFATDPAAFRTHLLIPGGNGVGRLGELMADFQRTDFAALDRAFLALAASRKPEVGRYWWERTKGASKDTDLAAALLWLLAFSPRPLTCQVGAADQGQADELRKAAKGVLRLNPWLAEVVEVQAWNILNTRTESRCEIIAADVAGSHGARPDLLILNELSHVTKREFAENLLDNATKVPQGVVCIATNAGFVPSWQWDWRENARTSPRWHFSAYTRPAPWLDPAEVDEARRRNNRERFARLWQGTWVRGAGDALAAADIEAAVTATGPMTGWEPGYVFYGGLDLGVSRDHAALVSLGLDHDRRVRLAAVQSWSPPLGGKIDLQAVEQAVLKADAQYRYFAFCFDTYQAELMGQRLKSRGVPVEGVNFTVATLQEMATALLERFNSREIELYRDDRLLADLH